MGAQVWFGPYGNMQWIDAPMKGASTTRSGPTAVTQFLNGSATVVRTGRSAAPAWSWLTDRATAARIQAILEGVYGPPPYLYADPLILNLFPVNWASPALIADGWQPPIKVFTIMNAVQMTDYFAAGYNSDTNSPKRGAPREIAFTVQGGFDSRTDPTQLPKLSLPVPPGYYLHVKTWGSVAGAAGQGTLLRCTPFAPTTLAQGTDVDVVPTAAGTVQSFNGSTVGRVDFRWHTYNTVGSPAYVPIHRGSVAILTKSSTPPATFDWTPGEGVAGLDIAEFPNTSSYTTPVGVRTALDVKLQEVSL